MKYLFLTLIMGGLLLAGCKRNILFGTGQTTVEGTVKDAISGNAIPGAAVSITSKDKDVVGGWYSELTYTVADENGHYELEFDAELGYTYQVRAFHDLYNEVDTQVEVKRARKNNNTDIKLKPYGWVRANFINEPPLDTASSIGCNSCLNNPFRIWSVSLDTFQIEQVLAGQEYRLIFSIYKKEIRSVTTIWINVPPLDTVDCIVTY